MLNVFLSENSSTCYYYKNNTCKHKYFTPENFTYEVSFRIKQLNNLNYDEYFLKYPGIYKAECIEKRRKIV